MKMVSNLALTQQFSEFPAEFLVFFSQILKNIMFSTLLFFKFRRFTIFCYKSINMIFLGVAASLEYVLTASHRLQISTCKYD